MNHREGSGNWAQVFLSADLSLHNQSDSFLLFLKETNCSGKTT